MSEHPCAGNVFGLKWTPDQDEVLKRLRDNGYSSSQIAGELWQRFQISYSRNAVIGRAHRLGLTDPTVRRTPSVTKPRRDGQRKPPRPQISAEEVTMRCVEIVPRNLSLLELERGDCRYPYGEQTITFCGHPKANGSSYCESHFALTINRRGNIGHEAPPAWIAAMRKCLPTAQVLREKFWPGEAEA